jgi:hypothetical protein
MREQMERRLEKDIGSAKVYFPTRAFERLAGVVVLALSGPQYTADAVTAHFQRTKVYCCNPCVACQMPLLSATYLLCRGQTGSRK